MTGWAGVQYYQYAALLLLVWIAWRILTVVILPFVRERAWGVRGVRAVRAGSGDRSVGEGRAASFAGTAMLILIALWIAELVARIILGGTLGVATSMHETLFLLLGLGLAAFAIHHPPRDLRSCADYLVLLALVVVLALGSLGLIGPVRPPSSETPWTAVILLAAAAPLVWRVVAFVVGPLLPGGGRQTG